MWKNLWKLKLREDLSPKQIINILSFEIGKQLKCSIAVITIDRMAALILV